MGIEVISALTALLVFIVIMFIRALAEPDKVDLIARFMGEDTGTGRYKASSSWFGRFYEKHINRNFGWLLSGFARLTGMDFDRLQGEITKAGLEDKLSAGEVAALKILGIIVLAVTMPACILSGDPVYIALSGAAAAALYTVPESRIKSAINARRQKIMDELPLFVEQMYLTIDSGATLNTALRQVADAAGGEIGREIRDALLAAEYSKKFGAELTAKGRELGVEPFEDFLSDVVNASDKGVSIVDTLRDEVTHINELTKQRRRALASKVDSRMTIASVLCFVVPLLGIMMFPIAVQMLDILGT